MKHFTFEEFTRQDGSDIMRKGTVDMIRKAIGILALADQEVTHIVQYRNITLDSSQLGTESHLMVGPELTYKTVDELDGKPLGDVPSRFQHPQGFITHQEFMDGVLSSKYGEGLRPR